MSEMQDLIARLWTRFQPLAAERVALIGSYVREPGAAPGPEVAHAAARQAAHDLVGSLGSYGHPDGSVLAARLEALLGHGPGEMDPAAQDEAQGLVVALERVVRR